MLDSVYHMTFEIAFLACKAQVLPYIPDIVSAVIT